MTKARTTRQLPIDFTLPDKLAAYHVATDEVRDMRTGVAVQPTRDGYTLFTAWFDTKTREVMKNAKCNHCRAAGWVAQILVFKLTNWPRVEHVAIKRDEAA